MDGPLKKTALSSLKSKTPLEVMRNDGQQVPPHHHNNVIVGLGRLGLCEQALANLIDIVVVVEGEILMDTFHFRK